MTDDNNNPSAGSAEWDGTNLAGDIVERGIQRNKPEYHDDLRWWFRYAHIERKPTMSQAEAARALGIDGGTYSKVYRGEYKNAQQLVLPPPTMMLSRIRVTRDQERENASELNKGRVKTPTVEEIWLVLRKAWNDRQLAFIWGNSRVGKTESGVWFRDENNHGATIFVDVQGCMGVQDIYRAFARALKISPDTPIAKLMPRIYASIDRTNFVIIDEFHYITYAYQKGGAVRMINAIKAIKDRCGCGMGIFSTNVGRDECTEGVGKDGKLLTQLWRRGVLKLQLPDALRVGDVRAFAKAYGLEFPDAPEKGDDTWANLRANNAGFGTTLGHDSQRRALPSAMDLCENIAYNFGVEQLVTVLKDGGKLASKRGRALQWKDVAEAQAVFDRLAAKKNV